MRAARLTGRCLQVCTPQGYLFSYEAILQNLLEQKQRYKRDLKAFKRQQSAGECECVCASCTVDVQCAAIQRPRRSPMASEPSKTQNLQSLSMVKV